MQNVSPGTENEGTGRNVAEGNKIGTHVIVPGIVNVEQISSNPQASFEAGCKAMAGRGLPGNPTTSGGAAS